MKRRSGLRVQLLVEPSSFLRSRCWQGAQRSAKDNTAIAERRAIELLALPASLEKHRHNKPRRSKEASKRRRCLGVISSRCSWGPRTSRGLGPSAAHRETAHCVVVAPDLEFDEPTRASVLCLGERWRVDLSC